MAEIAVQIEKVSHRYGELVALKEVTFSVPSGFLFGLLGPNGGGKTTLFRIISTLIAPESGFARVFDYDTLDQPAKVRRNIGVVFQQPALDEELTVLENLQFHGALYQMHGGALNQRIEYLAAEFQVNDRLKDRVKTLSGGLKRRVDLIRGLLHEPKVLLLDEPTSGLDPAARHSFWQALSYLRQTNGTTMILATHLMEEAERCDRIGIIDQGRLVVVGSPDELKDGLGSETLWLESTDPVSLSDRIQAQFGFSAQVIGRAVQISHPEVHNMLGPLYEAFDDYILSATVRRPSLEDVFMVHTGNKLEVNDSILR